MDDPILAPILGSLLRGALLMLSGWFVHQGWITDDQGHQLADVLFTKVLIYGPAVIAIAWSIYAKLRARLKVAVALDLPAGSDHIDLAQKMTTTTVSDTLSGVAP